MKLPKTTITSVFLKRFALVLAAGTVLGIGNAGASAPVNDDFANATDLTGTGSGQTGDATSGTLTGGTTIDATFQTGEPVCWYGTTTNTVWFKWTSPTTGNFTLKTQGSTNPDSGDWDAVVGVYTGTSLADLVLNPDLAMNPQDSGGPETVVFQATSGTTYYFQLGGDNGDPPQDAANILLTWSVVIPPPPTVVDIDNTHNPVSPADPGGQGININNEVGLGNIGRLVGRTETHWSSGGFSVPLQLNGNTLVLANGGNEHNDSGAISGDGVVLFNYSPNWTLRIGGSHGNTYTGITTVSYPVILAKSSGDALCGTITLNNQGSLRWAGSNQISDASAVTLVQASSKLDLADHSDTIASLTLATGASVATGTVTGGVLTVGALTVNGAVMPTGTYTSTTNPEFVSGLGSVVVGVVGSAYDTWAGLHAGGQTAGGDYNNDGVSNGVAYFMGMNGLATNPGVVNGKVTWPHLGTVASWEVQVSNDLAIWNTASTGVDVSDPSKVVFTLPTGAPQKFCRLMVVP